jgi:uncharacterized protein YceH (UPF0502 family)
LTSRVLTTIQVRVLFVLLEKQHTVPDSYPLSLNALTMGCNQKTAREPVMTLSEADVLEAVNALKELNLVNEVSGNRVTRFEHNAARGLGVPSQSAALLAMLALRGHQTPAELRMHTERLHRFADTSSVEGFLDELAEREPARVVKLPRAPGAREARWAHLLCGEVQATAPSGAGNDSAIPASIELELGELRAEQVRMAQEIQSLRALVQRLAGELGIEISPAP